MPKKRKATAARLANAKAGRESLSAKRRKSVGDDSELSEENSEEKVSDSENERVCVDKVKDTQI